MYALQLGGKTYQVEVEEHGDHVKLSRFHEKHRMDIELHFAGDSDAACSADELLEILKKEYIENMLSADR